MDEDIELSIDLPGGGVADCRLEPEMSDDDVLTYSATILYPQVINGYNRSDIYCYSMSASETGAYIFNENDDIYPAIRKLELQLSAAIKEHLNKNGHRQ